MPRIVVITENTKLDALGSTLLNGRLSDAQASSALESLQAMNPHVDLRNVAAGTVLLVPDAPGFKASATEPVAADAIGDFRKILLDNLNAAAGRMKAGNAARAEERAAVAGVQKTAAFKRIVERDPQLRQEMEDASNAGKEEQREAAQGEKAIDAAVKGATAELANLARLLGGA
jgi:hypothetical protein